MPIFRVKSVKIYTDAVRGVRDKYEVWVSLLDTILLKLWIDWPMCSLRNPPAFCGAFSLKPTVGRHLSQVRRYLMKTYYYLTFHQVGWLTIKITIALYSPTNYFQIWVNSPSTPLFVSPSCFRYICKTPPLRLDDTLVRVLVIASDAPNSQVGVEEVLGNLVPKHPDWPVVFLKMTFIIQCRSI